MYDERYSKNSEVEVDRAEYSYEQQINELKNLCSRLEDKVRPFSENGDNMTASDSRPTPIRVTQLGRDLDGVVCRLGSIVNRIQP